MQHSTRQLTETTLHSAGQIAENASGYQIHATKASRVDKCVCQKCKQKVVLRIGKKILKNGQMMITHFAHSVTNVIKCSGYTGGETVEHLDAKWCLADNIEDFRFIMQSCDTCKVLNPQYCVRFNKQEWTVVVEGQVTGTGTRKRPRRADVLIQLKTQTNCMLLKPLYSLEVRHSHAVSMEKTKELHSVNCGIIEVLATDVLHFKDMLQVDKPCYLRNVHNTGCLPWTCMTCMERVATEHAARWVDYEEWYASQWVYQDALNAKVARDLEFPLFIAARDLKISAELLVTVKKRKRLQAQAFQLMESFETTRFEKTLSKCVGKCVACHAWIYHENYHTFYANDDMTESERWWRDAIRNDGYLSNMYRVNKMIFCGNCVWSCLNCDTTQPFDVLGTYGLCRLCNTDDTWFDMYENGNG
ncbi:hypothetical protein T484DRAFT_1756908 [Baffinella frigidus]|nr:hypothetical protein T484DRAFT_1756908 [Cryptophyta sp. CCMP2293]